ncbi:DUF4062 domain-containing protein [Paraburkholderia sp. BR10872]|uniref:DUF4062 domain-containing protein n=1 Tax=Paraburkholderia sp. BR10872 TaxID=3236989 RepID=UPI0034D29821
MSLLTGRMFPHAVEVFQLADSQPSLQPPTTNNQTQDQMQRPTVFISSTIYDFQDLRSSLKFYLEEQGFIVLASEFNDFQKPLNLHSYEACLEAVRSADYFILLIGTRVGGWYDEQNRISITQREYREAYELHKQGKLKLLSFVRSEVWQAKEERSAQRKHLKTTDLAPAIQKSAASYESKSMEDAEFISKFISEVGRNAETKLAVQGQGVAPSGNWIHQFVTFRDIVDALNGQIFSSIPVEDMTTRRLLRRELREFVKQCVIKGRDSVLSPRGSIDRFHLEHPINLDSRNAEFTTVSTRRWNTTSSLAIHLMGRKFHPIVLPQVLTRSTFLEFDLDSDSFQETPVYGALVRLDDEIRRFNECNTTDNRQVIFKHSPRARPSGASEVEIETMQLAGLLHLLDRWVNILELSVSLLKFLDGQAFQLPSLRPDTPVQGMEKELDAEKPSDDEITTFIAQY